MKFLLQLLGVSLVSIGLGFSYRFHLPQLEQWLLMNIEQYSKENLPVDIKAGGIGISLYPIALEVRDIGITPKSSLSESISPISIQRILIEPDFTLLIFGRLEISQVLLDGVNFGFVVKEPIQGLTEKAEDSKPPWYSLPNKKDFNIGQWIQEAPIDRLRVRDLSYSAAFESQKISNLVKGLSLDVNRIDEELFVELKAPGFQLKETDNKKSLVTLAIASKLVVSEKKIHLTSFKLTQKDSFLDLNFLLSNYLNPDEQSFKLKLNSSLNLPTSTKLISRFNSNIKLPKLQGSSKIRLELDSTNLKQLDGSIQMKDFGIDQFFVGNLNSDIVLSSNQLKLSNTNIQQSENKLELQDTIFEFPIANKSKLSFLSFLPNFSAVNFQSKVHIEKLYVEKLLDHLGLKDIPIELLAKTESLNCVGKLTPNFSTSCSGKVDIDSFRVYTPEENFTIHSFKNASVEGSVVINESGVFPQGNLKLENASGYAKGSVLYKKGFQFDYSSEWFDFSNIESLANLNIIGKVKTTGSTYGDSSFGIINMNLEAEDFELEKYHLGKFSTELLYKSGTLSFREIKAQLPRSSYFGDLDVDLLDSKIQGNIKSPNFQLADLSLIVKHQLSIPFDLRANGPLDLSFQGPLAFSQLNYALNYRSDSLRIEEENFEKLVVNLEAQDGLMRSKELKMLKQATPISGQLSLSPSLELDGSFVTQGLNLSSFNFSQRLTSKLSSIIQAKVDIKGKIPELSYKWQAKLSNLSIGASILGDSLLDGELDQESYTVNGDFFDNRVVLRSKIPGKKSKDFLLNLKVEDFNFSPLFYLIGINAERSGYRSNLSAAIDLSSQEGGFWNSSGHIDITAFEVDRGGISMRSKGPFYLEAKKGSFSSGPWRVIGNDTALDLQVLNSSSQDLNLTAQGEINLALASFLVPFVEDLTGNLQLSFGLQGPVSSPAISGSAALKNTFFKIPNFAHPFENVRADILFSDKKLIFNKIDALLAGGKILGNGSMELLAFNNIPTKLSARLTDAKLQLIEGISLNTMADLNLSGSWFPFKLSANARILSGEIRPENDKNLNSKIRPSRYLPDFLLNSTFDPIEIDVNAEILPKVQIISKELVSYTQGKLNLKGPLSKIAYTGDLSLVPSGTLFFKDTGFEVRTGSIRFKNDTQFNPEIYINGTTSIVEQTSNNNYEVEILLQGNLNNFSTKLNSQPNLAENDLITLLALGLTASQLESQTLDNQRDLQMYEIGAAVLSQTPLSKEIKDKTGFNFSLHSDIDETNSTQYKVVISKQVTPKIGASASILGNNAKKDVKLEYKLNQGVSLIGSWESNTYNENSSSATDQTEASDIFGLDLRYKVEFK